MKLTRRTALTAAAGLLATPAIAQSGFPNRPIRLIVPWPPGGSTDGQLRALAEAGSRYLGQQVIIDNRGGASGTLAAAAMAQEQRGDGYMVGQLPITVFRFPMMSSRPTWDPMKDFTYIIHLTGYLFGVVVKADSPWKNWEEFLAYAKANPGKVGTGSTEALSSFIGQEMARRAGVEMPDIAYRSGGPLMNDIVAGHLPSGWTSTVSAMPHMQTGRVRVLAASTGTRSPFFPDSPTPAEQGVRDFDLSGWVAMLGPPRMAPALVDRIYRTVSAVFADETFKQRLVALGVEADMRPGAALLEAMQRDDRIWAAASAAGHIRPQ